MHRALTIAAIVCMAGVAHADTPAPHDAAADVLFEYARTLVRDGRYAEACPKFEESLRIQPGIGTRFNLADCWERGGKLASAWAAFVKVATETHALGQTPREEAARERARALEPRLGRLAIDVPGKAASLDVRCDGQPVATALWSVPVPMDAGNHFVEVRSQGQTKWSALVTVEDGRTARIATPPLGASEDEPRGAAPRAPEGPPREHSGTQRTVGFILMGGSALVLGIGVLGLVAREHAVSDYNADATCPSLDAPTRPAPCEDRVSTANTWRTAAVVGFITGGLLLGAGAALVLTAPSHPSAPAVACGPAGLGASCAFRF